MFWLILADYISKGAWADIFFSKIKRKDPERPGHQWPYLLFFMVIEESWSLEPASTSFGKHFQIKYSVSEKNQKFTEEQTSHKVLIKTAEQSQISDSEGLFSLWTYVYPRAISNLIDFIIIILNLLHVLLCRLHSVLAKVLLCKPEGGNINTDFSWSSSLELLEF